MKIKNFIKRSVMFLAIVGFVPVLAMANPRKGFKDDHSPQAFHGNPMFAIWNNPQLIKELNLTESQIEKLKDLDFAQQEKQMKLKNQVEALHLEMRKAFADNKLDEKRIISLAKQISEVQGNLFVQDVENKLEIAKVLTDEQVNKLKSLRFDQRRPDFPHDQKQLGGRPGPGEFRN